MSTATDNSTQRPITLLICALGGEGGGVLVEWLVRTATACGFAAQSTSIPGVAQRTGSTTYYIEIFPVPLDQLAGKKPVFSLYPVPGALDILVSSELLETVRQIGNGMVSPDRTRVLTSTSRTLTTLEKMQLTDGRIGQQELLDVVGRYAQWYRTMEMSALANESGTVVSAVLLGAIAGSELLPFSRQAFEAAIRQSERGVEASLNGFARAFERVRQSGEVRASTGSAPAVPAPFATVAQQVLDAFPPALHEIIGLGYARMIEYQDRDYAIRYIDRLLLVLAAEKTVDPTGRHEFALTREVARYLALWMAFDDIVRVAELKTRASRLARVRGEVKAAPQELLRVYDFFKPGVPEIAGLLPGPLARLLLSRDARRRNAGKAPIAFPVKLPAHTVSGVIALRVVASLRWLRKRSLRYQHEQAMIERWLDGVATGLRAGWQAGFEVALCARLIKGYGTTNERGKENLQHVLDQLLPSHADDGEALAAAVRAVRESAMADDTGKELDRVLVAVGAQPRPVKAQPLIWMKKPRQKAARV